MNDENTKDVKSMTWITLKKEAKKGAPSKIEGKRNL